MAITDEYFDNYETTVGKLLKILKYSADKTNLRKKLREDDAYRHLSPEDADVINTLINGNLKVDKNAKEIDMCKAIEDMIQDVRDEFAEAMAEKDDQLQMQKEQLLQKDQQLSQKDQQLSQQNQQLSQLTQQMLEMKETLRPLDT